VKGVAAGIGSWLGVLAIALLAGSGCGYQLVDYAEPLAGVGSVKLRTFRNDSFEPGIEFVVADALRREFLRRGAVRLADESATADLVISGHVEPVLTRTRSFSSVVLALEWEVTLKLRVQIARPDGSLILLDDGAMQDTERYLASADVEATRKNRGEAIRKMAEVLAARVHDLLYEVNTQ
jgi:hypothetical protein